MEVRNDKAMTIKISWGKRIAILYVGFVAIIVTLVVGSMRQDFDLVSKDYYEQEIAYQSTLDAGKNQAALSGPIMLSIAGEQVTLKFPAEFSGRLVNADLHFYSPVRSSQDKKCRLRTENGVLSIPINELVASKYRVKISWDSEGTKYYQETLLDLSKR
jgi:hypothetical protein